MLRTRLFVAWPHEAEQADHELQSVMLQWMGHRCVLHTCVSTRAGQPFPPWADGTTTTRSRRRIPPAHSLSHKSHDDHIDTAQLTGHKVPPHRVVRRKTGHGAPPCLAGVSTDRVSCFLPPPQLALQALALIHDETTQSTAQGAMSHAAVSINGGHNTPGLTLARGRRVRV